MIHFFIEKKIRKIENQFVRGSTQETLKRSQNKTKGRWKIVLKIIEEINAPGIKETMDDMQNPKLNLQDKGRIST